MCGRKATGQQEEGTEAAAQARAQEDPALKASVRCAEEKRDSRV